MIDERRYIPGFEGLYRIDINITEVRCWSVRRGKYLSNNIDKRNKRIIWNLFKNGKAKCYQAAKWVAITFPELVQGEYFEGAEIDHIDTNRLNNHPSNLRWVTRKENANNPLTIVHKKESSKASKPVLQYTLEGKYIAEYSSQTEAEIETGIAQANISFCCRGKTKKAGTRNGPKYIWKYKE